MKIIQVTDLPLELGFVLPVALDFLQASTLTHVCAKSNLWTSAGSTGCPSCTTCAPQSAPLPAALTHRAMRRSRRTRAACPLTVCREFFWDSPAWKSLWPSLALSGATVFNTSTNCCQTSTHTHTVLTVAVCNAQNVRLRSFLLWPWKHVFGKGSIPLLTTHYSTEQEYWNIHIPHVATQSWSKCWSYGWAEEGSKVRQSLEERQNSFSFQGCILYPSHFFNTWCSFISYSTLFWKFVFVIYWLHTASFH